MQVKQAETLSVSSGSAVPLVSRKLLTVDTFRGVERTSGIMAPTETIVIPPSAATARGTGVPVFTSFSNDPIGEYRGALGGFVLLGVASLWIVLV
jgi:hypothetical protein